MRDFDRSEIAEVCGPRRSETRISGMLAAHGSL